MYLGRRVSHSQSIMIIITVIIIHRRRCRHRFRHHHHRHHISSSSSSLSSSLSSSSSSSSHLIIVVVVVVIAFVIIIIVVVITFVIIIIIITSHHHRCCSRHHLCHHHHISSSSSSLSSSPSSSSSSSSSSLLLSSSPPLVDYFTSAQIRWSCEDEHATWLSIFSLACDKRGHRSPSSWKPARERWRCGRGNWNLGVARRYGFRSIRPRGNSMGHAAAHEIPYHCSGQQNKLLNQILLSWNVKTIRGPIGDSGSFHIIPSSLLFFFITAVLWPFSRQVRVEWCAAPGTNGAAGQRRAARRNARGA